jgi:fumarylacetoacetase
VTSAVEVPPHSPFTLAGLPYGCARAEKASESFAAVAIGDFVLNLGAAAEDGLLPGDVATAAAHGNLDLILRLDRPRWRSLRDRVRELVTTGTSSVRRALVPVDEVELLLPFTVGDYVDFYSSIEHATNLGRLMRPGQEPLLPNWRHLPVGYHGRSSTVVVSGTPIVRPSGQLKPPDADVPEFAPCRMLDFELEVGFVTGGAPTALGDRIDVDDAESHIYGLVLVNDWSARDIQAWEYQPLGPFLAKSFATSISPWVVPLEALEPFRVPAPTQEPRPLPYLQESDRRGIGLSLEVRLGPAVVTSTNFRDMYWTMAQQLAHMTVNGSVVRPGDLYASGTVSGSTPGSQGSLIELTRRGAEPLRFADGTTRAFLEDGDTVTIEGWSGSGDERVGFGTVAGTILPPR